MSDREQELQDDACVEDDIIKVLRGRIVRPRLQSYNDYINRFIRFQSQFLIDRGMDPNFIGTHSVRKGADTFTSITSAPPITSIYNRVWVPMYNSVIFDLCSDSHYRHFERTAKALSRCSLFSIRSIDRSIH